MTTLKERATAYTDSIKGSLNQYHAYIKGAEEQKQIDIERACEVYRKELSEIINTFNKIGKGLYGIDELGETISLEGSIKDFHKAIASLT